MNARVQPLQSGDRLALAAQIEGAMVQLWAGRGVAELRAFGDKKWKQWSGYYRDPATLARDATSLEGKATVVYFTLNDVNPEARFRSPDILRELPKDGRTTSDDEITKRLFLPLDFDPRRLADTPSSNEQHEMSLTRARDVRAELRNEGWPDPVLLDTGNGGALLYRIDVAATDDGLVARCLKAMDLRFSDDLVHVDTAVSNPARIWKVPFTVAGAKGSHSAERPHRRSALLEAPNVIEIVGVEHLHALAAILPPEPKSTRQRPHIAAGFNIDAWITDHLPELTGPKTWQRGRKWTGSCPWNVAHTNASFYIVQFENGGIAAGCHHNGCQGLGWAELRESLEPSDREKHTRIRDQCEQPVAEEPAWLSDEAPPANGWDAAPASGSDPDEHSGVEVGDPMPSPENTDASAAMEDYTGPRLPKSCWRSGFEAFRQAYSHTTEAPDEYYWSCYLSGAGLMMGRQAKLGCGVDVFPNTYVANVGPSGYRKDPPQQAMRRFMPAVDESVRIIRGVGSPEGLIEPFESEHGSSSVRVLLDLNELSALLRKGKGEATSGLVPMLCTLYDCPPNYELRTRKKPVVATEPFLSIIAATTIDWVQTDMSELDVRGGLAGRLVYMVGPPKPPVPFPPKWDVNALTEAERLLRSVRDRHSVVREYELSLDARDLWATWYTAERARDYSNPLLGTIAKRLHTNAWKVALVFAGIEGTSEITAEQIAAAIEFAEYQRAAQAVVYEGFGDSKRVKTERRIVEVVRNHGPLANYQIRQRVRHVSAEDLDRSIKALARLGVIVLENGKWIVRKRRR